MNFIMIGDSIYNVTLIKRIYVTSNDKDLHLIVIEYDDRQSNMHFETSEIANQAFEDIEKHLDKVLHN